MIAVAHKLRFHPSIPNDLVNALEYYEGVSRMLSNRFRNSVDQRLDSIAQNPEIFPFDISPIRFAKIGRFPYLIFFVIKPEFISIIAIVHGAADPKKWRNRE